VRTAEDVLKYVIDQGLLTDADIVDGDVLVADASRRHHNVTVGLANGRGLFVKQHDLRQHARTLGREARAYELLWSAAPDFSRHHVPPLLSFGPQNDTLVLRLLDGVESLSAVHVRSADAAENSAEWLGRTLADLHDLAPTGALPAPRPWVLSAVLPPISALSDFSTSALSAIAIIQQTDIVRDALHKLRSGPELGMVHGDMRLDNCLVRFGEDDAVPEAVYLVDWELSGIGDTSADVGGIFCDYLAAWTRSIPSAPTVPIADSVRAGSVSLESIKRGAAAFGTRTASGGFRGAVSRDSPCDHCSGLGRVFPRRQWRRRSGSGR
jgi:hypothetical protein